jgi:hypothetical protein
MLSSIGWSTLFDAESRRNCSFYFGFGTAPGALALGARPSGDDSPRRAGPLYRPVRRLVNRSSVNKQIDFLGERAKKG